VPISQSFFGWLDHMILPWLCLSVGFIGLYSRVLRSSIIETEGEDFVRTAKAKGLTKRRILVHHVLRTSMIPIISLWGLDFAGVIGGGAILIETLFNLQGVGQYAAESIGLLDIPPIMVIVMYGTFFVVLLTTAVDILHAFAEPRVRLQV
jgi:peptide/nickel transport system permease protein